MESGEDLDLAYKGGKKELIRDKKAVKAATYEEEPGSDDELNVEEADDQLEGEDDEEGDEADESDDIDSEALDDDSVEEDVGAVPDEAPSDVKMKGQSRKRKEGGSGIEKRTVKKVRKDKGQKRKTRKAPGAPKRGKSAYIFFAQAKRESVKESLGDKATKVTDVMKAVAGLWRALSPEEKTEWEEKAKQDKERYQVELDNYKQLNLPLTVDRTTKRKSSGSRTKKEKNPDAPKRAPSSFLLWCKTFRSELRAQHPDLKNTEVSKLLGEKWKAMSEEAKAPFVRQAQEISKGYREASVHASHGSSAPDRNHHNEQHDDDESKPDAGKLDAVGAHGETSSGGARSVKVGEQGRGRSEGNGVVKEEGEKGKEAHCGSERVHGHDSKRPLAKAVLSASGKSAPLVSSPMET